MISFPAPLSVPRLRYSLTRDVPWRIELYVYVLAFIFVGLIIPLNYALAGYETVTGTSPDFKTVPWHWFYRFSPKPKPGTLCDAYRLDVGGSFITNYGLLPWTVLSVLPQGNETGGLPSNVYYKGESLTDCYLDYLELDQISATAATFKAEVHCPSSQLLIVTQSTLLPSLQVNTDTITSLPLDATVLLTVSYLDLYYANKSVDFPESQSSAQVQPSCSSGTPPSSCTTAPTRDLNADSGLDQAQLVALNRTFDIMTALVYFDLGQASPWNFLVNDALIDTLSSTSNDDFGGTSNVYQVLTGTNGWDQVNITADASDIGITPDTDATIMVEYSCRFQKPKSPGSVFLAVAVATLTLCNGAWKGTMLILVFLAKTQNQKDDAQNDLESQAVGEENTGESYGEKEIVGS